MKPKPLLALNHFTVPCSLLTALLFSVSRKPAEHYIELSDAQVPSPSTEPRPSSSFVREDCKAVYRTKKWPQVCPCDRFTTQRRYKSNKRKDRVPRVGRLCKGFLTLYWTRHGGRRIVTPTGPGQAGGLHLGSLVLEVQHDPQDFFGQAIGVYVVHVC